MENLNPQVGMYKKNHHLVFKPILHLKCHIAQKYIYFPNTFSGDAVHRQGDPAAHQEPSGGHPTHPQREGHDLDRGRHRGAARHAVLRRQIQGQVGHRKGVSAVAAKGVLPHQDLPSKRFQ